jgi:hypothetical protein
MTSDLRRRDVEQVIRAREVIKQAGQVLQAPMVDTLLGRKTFDPLPKGENEA